MSKPIAPDICSSFHCTSYPCDYCRKCSHAYFNGSAVIDGRKYRWEFNPRFGPSFSSRLGGECEWVPNSRHKVWKAFEKWHSKKFGSKEVRK